MHGSTQSIRIYGVLSLLPIIPLLCHLTPAAQAAVSGYTVKGVLDYKYHGTPPESFSYKFVVSVRDCQWRAETEWDGNRVEAWCDGTQVLKLMNGPFYGEKPLAAITPSTVPVDMPTPALTVLWTAFAASCQQRRLGRDLAILPSLASTGVPFKAAIEESGGRASFIKRVLYYSSERV